MPNRTNLSTRFLLLSAPIALLAASFLSAGACTVDFEAQCPDGTTQTAGGGDVGDPNVCKPNGQTAGASAAGSAGQPGAGGGGAAGGGMGPGGAGSGGNSAGANGAGPGFTIEQISLDTGDAHTCVSTPNSVHCWGSNLSGRLGTSADAATPHPEPALVENGALGVVREVALGAGHSCSLREDGRVLCWGTNDKGQLGTGASTANGNPHPNPTLVDDSILGVARQLAPGGEHTCALRDDGRVLCWGYNAAGQLGDATTAGTGTVTPVPLLLADTDLGIVEQLAADERHSCALRQGGRVLCWGANEKGQLGRGATSSGTNPAPALVSDSVLGVARQVAVGGGHTCGLRADGRVVCWGLNDFGQLGLSAGSGQTTGTPTPTLLDNGTLGVITQLALGARHTCALRADGRVLCWGNNAKGQLGTSTLAGTNTPTPTPVLVDDGALGVVRRLALGLEHSCALRDDGRVLCWGANKSGQLGSTTGLGADGPNPVPGLVEGLPSLTR